MDTTPLPAASSAAASRAEDPARIVVPGIGRAAGPASRAQAVFVAEATRETAAGARAVAAEVASAVIAALRAAGIAADDLWTAGLEVVPSWDHDGGRAVRTGFSVSNRIGCVVRDLDGLGRALDAGLEAGATGLDGITFQLADEAAAEDAARREAVADARHRAETIAAASGAALGRLLAIHEGGDHLPSPMPQPRRMALVAAETPTPVLPGTLEVTVTVSAEWELLAGK